MRKNRTIDQTSGLLPVAVREVDRLTCTVQQAVKLTGISDSQLYNLMKAGDLKYTHAAGRRLIYFASLKKLVGLDGDGVA